MALFLRRERKGLERYGEGVAVAPVLDDRGAVLDADESSAPVSVYYGLVRLEGARGAEFQLEELCSGDRVQAEGFHAGPFGSTLDLPCRGVSSGVGGRVGRTSAP